MFLVRAVFWLSIVILLIPGDPESGIEAPRVSALQALTAAQATVTDMSGFCERNPAVCVTGGEALKAFAEKARYSARMVYDYFGGSSADRGTLSDEDMEPAWRGRQGDDTPV